MHRAIQTKQNRSNSDYFVPFDGASVDRLLDGVERVAEVTAKGCFILDFVLDSLLLPSVRDDVCPTVGTTKTTT